MQDNSLLRNILNGAPSGIVLTSDYLRQSGVSRNLAWWYVHSNWLERLDDKAYKRVNDKIAWSGLLYTLQTIHKMDIHVSGRSAIGLSGKSHYLYFANTDNISVAIGQTVKVPSWFKRANFIPEKFNIPEFKCEILQMFWDYRVK